MSNATQKPVTYVGQRITILPSWKAKAALEAAQKEATHAAWGLSHACGTGNREATELARLNRDEAARAFEAAYEAAQPIYKAATQRDIERATLSGATHA